MQIDYGDTDEITVPNSDKENKMKVKTSVLLTLVFLAIFSIGTALAGDVTVSGELTDGYQIVTATGDVYDVADDAKGEELSENVGKKVVVQGTLMEEEGIKTITVTSFKVVE